MKWKISEVSKMTDIPIDTIRYYEKKGYVAPQRQGTYRFYTESDVYNLCEYKKLRSFGLSMKEITAMFHQDSLDDYTNRFEQLEEIYSYQAKYYQILHENTRQSVMTMQNIPADLNNFRQVEMPEKYYMDFYINKEHEYSDEFISIWREWVNKYYSLVQYIAIFDEKNIFSHMPENKYVWANALDAKTVKKLKISHPKCVKVLPKHKALYTVVCENGKHDFNISLLDNAKKYVESHGYQTAGKIVGKLIARVHEDGEPQQYIAFWIPIK